MRTQYHDEANGRFPQFPKRDPSPPPKKREPIALLSFYDYYLRSLKFCYKSRFKSRWNKRNQVKRI